MTINGLEGRAPIASFFKWHFSNGFALQSTRFPLTGTACSRGPSAAAELLVSTAWRWKQTWQGSGGDGIDVHHRVTEQSVTVDQRFTSLR